MNVVAVRENVAREDVFAAASSFLARYNISRYTLLAALLVAFLGWSINRLSNVVVERGIERHNGDEHTITSAKRLTAYIIYPLTFVAVLGVFGAPFSALGAAVGLIGLGISFALKELIANFISGLFLLVYRPFRIGDRLKVGEQEGTLKDIRLRASEIKTYDGRMVIVPNSKLYNETVINNTGYKKRRFDVMVGIGYDDDIKEAKELAESALEKAENIESDPEPEVLVDELGDSAVNLKLRGWIRNSGSSPVKASSEVTELVKQKYDEAGIDIPYPIRTVYMDEA